MARTKKLLDDVEIEELYVLDAAQMHPTSEGYLVASPRVSRTGIQIYKGYEVGRKDLDEVRVYRPPEEVFHADAMKSLAWRPVTLNHPDEDVTPKNWRKYGIGTSTGEVARDGEFIRVPLMLMDHDAIAATQDGHAQLSVGYAAKLKWGDGQTPDGEPYHAVQSQIRANHIAVVRMARGGPQLRMGDHTDDDDEQQRRLPMPRTMNLDGVSISLDDKDSQILERHLGELGKKLKDAQTSIDSMTAKLTEVTKSIESKDGEILGLTKKLTDAEWTPQKRDEAIRESKEIFDRARRVLGDKLNTDGKTDIAIKREVVAAEIGDEEAKAMSDEAITGVFRAVTRETKDNGLQRTANVLAQSAAPANASATAYQKYCDQLVNAHKAKSA